MGLGRGCFTVNKSFLIHCSQPTFGGESWGRLLECPTDKRFLSFLGGDLYEFLSASFAVQL